MDLVVIEHVMAVISNLQDMKCSILFHHLESLRGGAIDNIRIYVSVCVCVYVCVNILDMAVIARLVAYENKIIENFS